MLRGPRQTNRLARSMVSPDAKHRDLTIDWTLIVAFYGAIVSTVAIVWDVWKW